MVKRVIMSMSHCALLLIGLILFVSAQFTNEPITKGDVTNDGSVNVLDAYWTVMIILEIQLPDTSAMEEKMCAADVNGDGKINVVDVVLIVNEILYPDDDWFVSSCDELDCDDDNSCTQDYCDTFCVQCRHDNLPLGTPCDDGDLCTENDVCQNGNCVGTPKDCDDGNACTDDSCNPLTGECEHTNNTALCDDGDPCTENDVCQDGSCVGTSKDCDDGNPYTDDSCNPLTGECENVFPTCGTVTDIDGNTYQTIQLGTQCWMLENLKVTHYRNGDPIPHVTDNTEWSNLTTGAYCNYDNNEDNVNTYGRLYNWYAVDDSRNIGPEGWHVPTDAEWKQLEMYLGMSQSEADEIGLRGTDEGGKLKEAGTAHWDSPNTGATNESGFSALPGGNHFGDYQGFGAMGYYAGFWSSTECDSPNTNYAWYRGLHFDHSEVGRYHGYKRRGFSIRCVRD